MDSIVTKLQNDPRCDTDGSYVTCDLYLRLFKNNNKNEFWLSQSVLQDFGEHDIQAAPAQIALLQLEVGSQKKTVDVLHRIVDVMKKAAEASRKAFQKQADELRQLLTSQRPSPSILPVQAFKISEKLGRA